MIRTLLIAITLLLGFTTAQAQTKMYPSGYSACGTIASGIDRTIRDKANPRGKSVTGAFPGRAVSPEGFWFDCQPWVPEGGDPAMPQPKELPKCAARDTYEIWESNGRLCSSVPPGESTVTTLKLKETVVGRVGYITSGPEWLTQGKSTYGHKMFRCVALPNGSAEWRTEGTPECFYANDVKKP